VQLKYTQNGKFRQFGFVGFKSEEDALAAQKYFNGTYFGSSKIIVEECKSMSKNNKHWCLLYCQNLR